MARREIQFEAGKYYHTYNRGCNREKIFLNADNYEYLIRLLTKQLKKLPVTIIAYCLMPNHYHLLLRQDGNTPIDDFMQRIFNSYSKAFNLMHNRTGTLFEGPFKAILVDDDIYLTHLCRYIHRNPLDAGIVKNIQDWKYSNYLEWIGKRRSKLVDLGFITTYFQSVEEYGSFVLDYTPTNKINDGLSKFLF
jgi:putative transposase